MKYHSAMNKTVIPSLHLFSLFMSRAFLSLGFPTPKCCLMRKVLHLAPVNMILQQPVDNRHNQPKWEAKDNPGK